MSRAIGFHTDEHIGWAIINGLRRRGINVSATLEGLLSASDELQLARAHEASRVMVTQDTDFLRLHREGFRHSGIAFFRQRTSAGEVLKNLVLLYDVLTAEERVGRVEFL